MSWEYEYFQWNPDMHPRQVDELRRTLESLGWEPFAVTWEQHREDIPGVRVVHLRRQKTEHTARSL